MYSSRRSRGMTRAGLPHSGISGSTLVCSSPKLIAAYHALHRLLTPRHPPCALSSLVKSYDRPEETLSKRSSHYSRHLVKMLTRLSLFDCQRATETYPPTMRRFEHKQAFC